MGNFVYLVGDKKKKECALVDPAWDVDAVLKEAAKDGMKVVAGILTHTHFDHANGVEGLIQKTGAKIYVHENEAKFLKEFKEHLVETREGSKLQIGDLELTFLHTPGHTEGAQCVLAGDRIITWSLAVGFGAPVLRKGLSLNQSWTAKWAEMVAPAEKEEVWSSLPKWPYAAVFW